MKSNQAALITGATSGIGYELSKLFAKNGYNLVLTARNKQQISNYSKASSWIQRRLLKLATKP